MRILTWNAANLVRNNSRLHELYHIITSSEADIAIVTESELGQHDIAVIPGFKMFRSSPGTNGKSRLLAYVKDSIATSVIKVTSMEIWLTINPSNKPLTIAGLYRQWRDDEHAALENFYSNCEKALKYSRILVLGDFNLDITRTNDNSYCRSTMATNLTGRMESMGYFFAGPNSPTYYSYGTYNGCKRTSTIDLVYARGLTPTVTVLDNATTDHRPVLATVATRSVPLATGTEFVRNLKKVSPDIFCSTIESLLPENFYHMTNVDAAHESLVTAVISSLERVAPLRIAKTKQVNGYRLSLAADTLATMKQRDSISPSHPCFRTLRNRARKMVRRDAVDGALKAIDGAIANPKKLWDFARQHMGNVRASLPTSLSASDINNHFVEKIQKIRERIPTTTNTLAGRTVRTDQATFGFKFPSAGKVREVILSLRNTGALGIDGIGVKALKLGADAIAAPLAHIARLSFDQGIVPTGFKTAIVTPVHKGHGKPTDDVSSYRPVSILPAMSKVLERLVVEPLTSHLSELLPNSQYGFRAKRSTVAAIATAHGAWSKEKALGKTVAVAAYDMSSAFDTIDIDLLCTRLEEFGVKGTPIQWFKSYLMNRLQRVSAHGKISEPLPVSYGVPQGSILGPVLFLTMMAGFPDFANIDEGKGGTVGYADDVCCWATAGNDAEVKLEIERVSSRLLEYAATHKLAVNEKKTQVMWIRNETGPAVNVGHASVCDSKSLSLLGVAFDKNLRSTPYLRAQVSATRRIGGAVKALSRHLPSHVVSKVARALVLGKTCYGVAATIPPRLHNSDPTSSAVAAIQVAINDVARSTTGYCRNDRIPVTTLLNQSSLPSLNRLTVHNLAIETWKAINVCDGPQGQPNPLGCLIGEPGQGLRLTRTVQARHLIPPIKYAMPTLIWYSYVLWNSHQCLREATTLSEAKRAADTIAKQVPL